MEQQIRFCTASDGVRIAYAVTGEGPPLLWVHGWISHLDMEWRIPTWRRLWESLAGHFTLVRVDKRGTGLSDRDVGNYSVDARVRDLEAVVDALKVDRFALGGLSEGGPIGIAYAARNSDRVSRLVLWGAFARGAGLLTGQRAVQEAALSVMKAEWGLGSALLTELFLGDDAPAEAARAFTAYQRLAATAEDAVTMMEGALAFDVSGSLGQVEAPTLVVHARNDRAVPIELGRELAAGISGSRFVSVDGHHVPLTNAQIDEISAPILSFLLEGSESVILKPSSPSPPPPAPSSLVTILFTDIVGSTDFTQRVGDEQAQEAVRQHNTVVRDALRANGGSEIKHTGDGIMASFASARGAVDCAVAIQRALAAGDSVRVRIGLNAGEPVAEEQDLYGTSVQLAARVCAEAGAGEILVSDVVRQLVAGKRFLFNDRGDRALKGFEDPVKLYEVKWGE